MNLKDCFKAWVSFWCEPKSPEPVALFRILFGLLMLKSALIHIQTGLFAFYGKYGITSIDSIIRYFWQGSPRFDILLILPQTDAWLVGFFVVYIVASVFLTIGFCTRYSAIIVALCMISMHHHQPFSSNGGDDFTRLVSIFLACSYAGKAYSVDAYLKRRAGQATEGKLYCPWGQRMIQMQMAIVYCSTFICKISGTQWMDGTAVYYSSRLNDMLWLPWPFFDSMLFCWLLSWYTLVVEFSMFTFVWFKDLRYYVLAAAFFLHLGIDMSLNLPIFEWSFMAGLVTFIEPEDLKRALTTLKSWLTGQARLIPLAR